VECLFDTFIHNTTATTITPMAITANAMKRRRMILLRSARARDQLSPRCFFHRFPFGLPAPGIRETRPIVGASP
jgi:hypothetical protein